MKVGRLPHILAQLEARLAESEEAHSITTHGFAALQQEHDELTLNLVNLQERYNSLEERTTELGKRLQDGKEAHRDDIAAERRRYEALKAEQDKLVERYQTGKLVRIG